MTSLFHFLQFEVKRPRWYNHPSCFLLLNLRYPAWLAPVYFFKGKWSTCARFETVWEFSLKSVSRQSHSHFFIYQNVWCTVRVYHVYWQFYQVPLLLVPWAFPFFFCYPVRNSLCIFYTSRYWRSIKAEIAQNKTKRFVALNCRTTVNTVFRRLTKMVFFKDTSAFFDFRIIKLLKAFLRKSLLDEIEENDNRN